MTTHTELLDIITNGENSGVEFKRDVVSHFLWASSLKPCIRLVLNILWVGDELVKGCERSRDLGGAGCSRMLAACWNAI